MTSYKKYYTSQQIKNSKRTSRPISRVLSWAIIHLGCMLPHTSSNLPRNSAGRTIVPLLSLAPSGVFQRSLLPIEPVCSYHTFSPLPCYGGLFSVALSLRSPSPVINWHCVFMEPGLSSTDSMFNSDCLADSECLVYCYKY